MERHINERIASDRPVLKWAVENVGAMMTRFQIGSDGLTAYRRLKGRDFKKPLVEFGESVMYEVYRPTGGRAGKLEKRYEAGIFLGVRGVSHEYIISREDGEVTFANSIKRRPTDERWNASMIKAVIGVPWDFAGEREEQQERGGADREESAREEPPADLRGRMDEETEEMPKEENNMYDGLGKFV